MKKYVLIFGVVILFIGVGVSPNISGNIKTINEVVFKEVINDRIEDIYGLRYDNRGYIINNHLISEEANPLNTNNGPGEISPTWIIEYPLAYESIVYYNDYIYSAGFGMDEEEDYFMNIGKYSSNDGSLIWMRNWSTNRPHTLARSIDVYNDTIYVVGWTGDYDYLKWMDSFICKYDLDGNLLDNWIIDEATFDGFNDVKLYDNFLYLCGRKSGSRDFNAWFMKYDTNGNKIWSETYSIPKTYASVPSNLKVYKDYIYGVGTSNSNDYTHQDFFTMKISIDGELIWYKEWGGSGWEIGHAIDVYDDYIYVCGSGAEEYPQGNRDYLLKYNLDGKLQWDATSLCTPSYTSDIKVYNGSIFTVGEFYRGSINGWDIVLRKFDTDSRLIWYLTYGPCSSGLSDGECIDVYEDFFYIGGYYCNIPCLLKYDGSLLSDNNKPDTPDKPSGSTTGIPGIEYTYTTSATDPDGDQLSYDFYWGVWDITIIEWFDSGETISASNIWDERGKYNIKVRARDECGFVSDWSDPLEVNMPRNKAITSSLLLRFLEQFPILQKILSYLIE